MIHENVTVTRKDIGPECWPIYTAEWDRDKVQPGDQVLMSVELFEQSIRILSGQGVDRPMITPPPGSCQSCRTEICGWSAMSQAEIFRVYVPMTNPIVGSRKALRGFWEAAVMEQGGVPAPGGVTVRALGDRVMVAGRATRKETT